MSRLRSNIWLAVTVVFAAALVVLTLHYFVLRPSFIIPELGGDGAKNTFTYLYHSVWGKGYWFEGMNYPYGEHIVYTDAQPVLSVLLTHVSHVTPELALKVMWLFISFSFFLSIVFVYRILIRFGVAPLVALLGAGLIAVFSPQLFRLQGHYALSYTCVIPMLFYWTIRYNDLGRLRYIIYFLLTGCVMAFIHPYYAAMMLIWVCCYALGYFIFTKSTIRRKLLHVLPPLGSAVFVLVLIAVVMKLTDPVTDRQASPYNDLYVTCTHIKQIITSAYSPVWQKPGGKPRFYFVSETAEGYSYLGLTVVFVLAGCFLVGGLRSLRKKQLDILVDQKVFSPVWLFMAFAALLFGMGVPFIWHMEWLMDYAAIFRQFRSLGRFSWIFYYIIAIYSVVVLYGVYVRSVAQRRPIAGYAVLLLSFGLWSYEASGYIKHTRWLSFLGLYNYMSTYSYVAGQQNWKSFLAEHGRKAEDFQAILVVPFFHIGTEKLWVNDGGWMIYLGIKAALQLHLPMVDVMMSRSSWSQAFRQVKIAGSPFVDKPMLRDIKSNKPFLLIRYEDRVITPDERYLYEASDYLGHFEQSNIYACYPDRILANDRKYADSVNRILPYMKGADTVIAPQGTVYISHLDSAHRSDYFFGSGAMPWVKYNDSIVRYIRITDPPADSMLYEFSCWFLVPSSDYRAPYFTLQLLNDSGRVVSIPPPDALTKAGTDNHGMWLRAGAYFYVHSNCRSIRLLLIDDPSPSYIAMDELLLRPAGSMVISRAADGSVLVNNHLLNVAPQK